MDFEDRDRELDHPRLRGEHEGAGVRVAQHRRITPACAGSTSPPQTPYNSSWDHPRLRGEHTPPSAPRGSGRGSPPPARGALQLDVQLVQPPRITPACAGSTPILSNSSLVL